MATKSSSHSLSSSIDLQSGFCSQTKTYHSLRPHLPLPPRSLSLSITDFTLSLLRRNSPSSPPTSSALIDAASGHRTPYAELPALVGNLATSLHRRLGLGRGDSAFVLSPNSSRVPVLYLALFSLGVVVSSSNPISAAAEVSRQIELCRPAVAFVSGGVSEEIVSLFGRTVRLHEEEFESMMTARWEETVRIEVGQDDTAVILYSSVFQKIDESQKLSHRNDVSKTECSRPRPRGSVNAVGGVGDFTRTCSQLEVLDSCAIVVAPVELENLLQTHPDIVDAAVVPYPDEEAGQMPMAFIVKRPESTIDESDIKDFVARQVAPYKKIRRVSFVGSLPKNAPGKVLRKELIKLALLGVSSKL